MRDKTYLRELKVEIFRYGFPMGVSEDIVTHGKLIHDRNLKESVENGTMPIVTIYAVKVKDRERTERIMRKLYRSGMNIYKNMKNILKKYGYSDKPIWITETSTFSGEVGDVFQSEE